MAAYTTIDDPSAYFKVQLYTGNGSTQSITFDDTDTDMQPNLVWIKDRTRTDNHAVFDSVRGANEELKADSNAAEVTRTNSLSAFDSDGFSLGLNSMVNYNNDNYAAWCWKETADAGFDIVSFTGNDTARTISHSLSAVPQVMIIKNRERTTNWLMYHKEKSSAPETDYLELNGTPAVVDYPFWNDTSPTSSVFSVGSDAVVNKDGEGIITYLFTEKQGFSKFGSYTGNGNADGAFVWTGFKPAFLLIKNASATSDWNMRDSKRGDWPPGNPRQWILLANTTAAETTSATYAIDLLANGFKARATINNENTDDNSYIYMAFAESPFVNSKGVPGTAR